LDTEEQAKPKRGGWIRSLFVLLRRYLITGIIVIAPLAITVWVLLGLFTFIDRLAGKLLGEKLIRIPGVGIVLFVTVIILVGIFATNIIGKRLISFAERIMARIPLANKIYTAVQQISTAFLGSSRTIFSRVVLVEYPRRGLYSIGFLTSEAEGEVQYKTSQQVVCVFVPTTPNPTSGVLIFVPKEDLTYLAMTAEDGLKLVISGGVVAPPYRGKIAANPAALDKKE
jgi:uncharacterized membrane protein